MDFSLTPEQRELEQPELALAQRELGGDMRARAAVGGTLYSGTSEIQRNVIASLLGL